MSTTRNVVVLGGSALQLALRRLFGAMTTPPDDTRRAQIILRMTNLWNAGILQKLDLLYFTAAADSQAAKLNWINASASPLTEVASPTFTIDRGFTGNGTTSGVQTAANMTTLSKFQSESASMFAWSRTDGTGAGCDFGIVGASTTFSIIRSASNNMSSRLNTATSASVANAGAIGMFGLTRNNATDFQPYKNGAALGGALAAVSAAVFAGPFALCRGQASFSIREMACGGAGGYLTPAEMATLYTEVAAYMTAVGA